MRIAYISLWSPKVQKYWSGTPYFSYAAIRSRFPDVALIDTPRIDWVVFYASKLLRRVHLDPLREPLLLWFYRRAVKRQLNKSNADIIVSIGASHKLNGIVQGRKVIHVADALFATIVESYPAMSKLSSRSKRLGEQIQRDFLNNVDVLLLSSEWAIESARRHYDLANCRTRRLPLGANIQNDPGTRPLARPNLSHLSLLFVGGDWQRKRGALALEVFRRLREWFPEAELHIVGCSPDIPGDTKGVTVHGSLDKTDPQQAARFDQLFRRASFLIVPSSQEAYGLAYCEASAYGVPPIGTRTGGVSSIIDDSVTGMLFEAEDDASAYAARIRELWQDQQAYLTMSLAARKNFETRLSWQAWSQEVAAEVERLGQADPSRRD